MSGRGNLADLNFAGSYGAVVSALVSVWKFNKKKGVSQREGVWTLS